MLRTRLYYSAKPFLPWKLRMTLRRWHAKRILRRCGDVWPILESAGRKPDGWPGWPDGKQFALVLTHDVEGQRGLDRVRQLAELEMELGFRSSFNFVPEGEYTVPPALRSWLSDNGFEVGVHDLHHDGLLYRSRADFRRNAERINHYLRDWGAVGFRSGFMLHNLDWLHDLEIGYDASTFDTDPFEPQPDGVGTIFPFWVPRPTARDQRSEIRDQRSDMTSPSSRLTSGLRPVTSDLRPLTSGYVELPYTLPQDSTVFFLLRERGPDLWLRKLNWIAQQGGMVLLNVHPDYVRFDGDVERGVDFPVAHYRRFLTHVRDNCRDAVWAYNPREVATLVAQRCFLGSRDSGPITVQPEYSQRSRVDSEPQTVWIDLENTPHIPFFKPIIRELSQRGHRVIITARDAYQTCEMANRYGYQYRVIGHHYGKRRVAKMMGLFIRAAQLIPYAVKHRPTLGLNHGSRTQNLACNLLRIPTVTMGDYEHAAEFDFLRPTWEIIPELLAGRPSPFGCKRPALTYTGIKEDVYVPEFVPDESVVAHLGLDDARIVVTVRPPASEAHYHNPEADVLLREFMGRIKGDPAIKVILLPRNKRQEAQFRAEMPQWFDGSQVIIPRGVVDGLNLLWHSDLAVSGGGTMNREAAALGVPVYSIFRGKIGAVDSYLESRGLLTLIRTPAEVHTRIRLERRDKSPTPSRKSATTLKEVVGHIEGALKNGR